MKAISYLVIPAKAGIQPLDAQPMNKGGWVYILANRYRGTIYIGVTAALAQRTVQHRKGAGSAFARKYGCDRLVMAEFYPTIEDAIARGSNSRNGTGIGKSA